MLGWVLAAAQQFDGVTDYALVWKAPARDAADSVPMGNGELAANVWVEEGGDLVLLLARHDSHSEASRLLKPGWVRISFDPPPTGDFEQTLNLYAGRLEIRWGDLELEVFAEPDLPRFRVLGRSGTARRVRARAEIWRTEERRLTGDALESSWTMRRAPDSIAVVESADALADLPGAVGWYHRNATSPVAFTLDRQGLASAAELAGDPLAGLTFGGALAGLDFYPLAPDTLIGETAMRRFDLAIACPPAARTDGPGLSRWLTEAAALVQHPRAGDEARAATAVFWESFWLRSWIFVREDEGQDSRSLPDFRQPLRLGVDSNGQNRWEGEFASARVFLTNDQEEWEHVLFAEPLISDRRVQEVSRTTLAPTDIPIPCLSLSAWLRRDPSGKPARIIDCITAGGSDGFLFDTHPGNALRLIVSSHTLVAPGAWPDDGDWHHVAATYDARDDSMSIWLDGELVASNESPGPPPPSRVTQAYLLQRWVTACHGRGSFPIKFNGGLFTVEPRHAGGPDQDADWRRWGDCFWWQNTRLPYYPMLAAGDFELMDPLFDFYARVLPLSRARAEIYYGADGAYFPETITPFGTYANADYGWDRGDAPPGEVHCPWWQWAWNQGLELVDLMLLRDEYAPDEAFARERLLPMAREVLEYFDSRFARDERGILRITPTQALETHWHGVVNDMPCVAGLRSVLPRLQTLPDSWLTEEDAALFARLAAALPPLPVREEDGVRLLAPAEEYDPSRQNVETPELYATFPFRQAAVGGDDADLALALEAYARRHDRQHRGWTQDGLFAARLGLTEEARTDLLARVANTHPEYRFPATWGPNFDWLPDQCHGGNLQMLLQEMLLQHDGDRILLFPAWPKEWDADFRLHAPGETVVECSLIGGEIVFLQVTPASRAADVVVMLD